MSPILVLAGYIGREREHTQKPANDTRPINISNQKTTAIKTSPPPPPPPPQRNWLSLSYFVLLIIIVN